MYTEKGKLVFEPGDNRDEYDCLTYAWEGLQHAYWAGDLDPTEAREFERFQRWQAPDVEDRTFSPQGVSLIIKGIRRQRGFELEHLGPHIVDKHEAVTAVEIAERLRSFTMNPELAEI